MLLTSLAIAGSLLLGWLLLLGYLRFHPAYGSNHQFSLPLLILAPAFAAHILLPFPSLAFIPLTIDLLLLAELITSRICALFDRRPHSRSPGPLSILTVTAEYKGAQQEAHIFMRNDNDDGSPEGRVQPISPAHPNLSKEAWVEQFRRIAPPDRVREELAEALM